MNLYNKYRPKTLDDLMGNENLISELKSLLSEPSKMPHAYLLAGATGCGKTTIARIIKNALNVSDHDYSEINASDFRGIDTIRDLIKNSQYMPMNSPYRIYLLDEAHQLSKDAQNALLKPLEDTPVHVIFILCTTEPEKLLKTIQGRCQNFTVKTLSDSEMKKLLKQIARKEGESLELDVLEQIVMDSNGHPRNAINVLEKVLSVEPEQRLESAQTTALEMSQSLELCKALLNNSNWKQIKAILKGLQGQEPETIRRHVIGYASAVLINNENDKAGLILEMFIEPFYNSGFPGLTLACYLVIKN